jgi:hypothetical protein
MSWYASDELPELNHPSVFAVVGGVYEVDVAAHLNADRDHAVRLILRHESAYMTSDEARAIAAGLIRSADTADEYCAPEDEREAQG